MRIKDIISGLITKHGTNDPFFIAERRNILIFRELLGSILGYYNSSRRTQMVHINVELDNETSRFVCAHELGHAILHPKMNTPFLRSHTFFSVDKVEREANTFAVELLVPDSAVHRSSTECVTVREAAAIYGVPHELIGLKTLG